jgi:galactokinase/mevalonate kinase-like predicted kinase
MEYNEATTDELVKKQVSSLSNEEESQLEVLMQKKQAERDAMLINATNEYNNFVKVWSEKWNVKLQAELRVTFR